MALLLAILDHDNNSHVFIDMFADAFNSIMGTAARAFEDQRQQTRKRKQATLPSSPVDVALQIAMCMPIHDKCFLEQSKLILAALSAYRLGRYFRLCCNDMDGLLAGMASSMVAESGSQRAQSFFVLSLDAAHGEAVEACTTDLHHDDANRRTAVHG